MSLKHLVIAAAALAVSAPLFARTPRCTDLDKAHWIPAHAMQEKFAGQGYKVIEFGVVDSCYKARLEDKDGRQVEGFYNPVGGYPVRRQAM